MKKLIIIGFLLCGFLSINAFAETVPLQITNGRFFITPANGYYPGEPNYNAVINTEKFSAASYLGGTYSPWNEVCYAYNCRPGKTFTAPQSPTVYIGGCIGGCSGPQFAFGTFAINGVIYKNAYFSGSFSFSPETFSIPKLIKRKGSMKFTKPFTMTGRIKVCSEKDYDKNCPADKILFDGQISGRGNLTVIMEIKKADSSLPFSVYLRQKSFEYQFTD